MGAGRDGRAGRSLWGGGSDILTLSSLGSTKPGTAAAGPEGLLEPLLELQEQEEAAGEGNCAGSKLPAGLDVF